MESKKPAVPKFASFKQKRDDPLKSPLPETQPEKDQSRRDHDRKRGPDSHDRHRDTHTNNSSHSQYRQHDRQRTRGASPQTAPVQQAPREEPLYMVDKRGDPMIVRYGSNERSKVPSYRRYGAGTLLGANGRLRFLYDGSKELFSLGNKTGEGPSVFHDRALMSKAARQRTRVFRLRPESSQQQAQAVEDEPDFLPLSDSRIVKKGTHEASGDEAPNYRSIQGKAKARDFVDSDLESADTSASDAEAELDALNPTKQRSVELSRQVKDHPEDVEAWLEFVDIQEPLLRLNQDVYPDRTNDEAKGLASIRLALLEEALPHATSEADKETLFLRLMREGAKVWSSKVLSKRWAEVNVKSSRSFALWKAHLDHELCSMSTFTYPALKQLHVARLRQLQERLAETISSTGSCVEVKHSGETCTESNTTGALATICEEMTYVFLRLTCFIRDAGYSELSIAAWQALLELTFARPMDEPEQTHAEAMSSFRDFWESEVPRIGEEGAKGWRHFIEAAEMADLPDAKTEAAPAVPHTKDVYKAWAAVETQRSRNASLPARTLDEGTEADPFRVVMFADLEPLLFHLPSAVHSMPKVQAAIVHSFLLFCQLPAPRMDTCDLIKAATFGPFVYRESARLAQTQVGQRGDAGDGTRQPPRFSDLGHHFAISADVAFSTSSWFQLLHQEPCPEFDMALAATSQLATLFGYSHIAEYSLGMSWSKNPSSIKKAAKALLKKWPFDTQLYHAYAVAEWRNGNIDVARHVLTSATGQELDDKARLWASWAWLEMEGGNVKAALSRCIAAVGTTSAGTEANIASVGILKARQMISSRREFLLSTGDIHQAAVFAELSAILEYLAPAASVADVTARRGDIQAAMDSIHTFTDEAVSRGHTGSSSLQLVLQFAAHLLYLHAKRGPFRPNYIREQFHKFVTLFPSNTIFLTLFAWADTSLLLNDPVRTVLRTHVLAKQNDCLTSRLFALQHEMHSLGSAHSVRTAFERALDSDVCRGNAGLWLSYVRFCEMKRKELRGKAKDVYYRALSACPWSKELAMEAFTTLLRDMESNELRAVWNTMSSKGLRMCVDLDEFGAEWGKRPGRSG
ncbi:unnamed protein product [Discula destructiva]